MITVNKIKKALENKEISFYDDDNDIYCLIGNTSFCFLDTAKTVEELFNCNSIRSLAKKIKANLKALKLYSPVIYKEIVNYISVKF